MHDHMNPIFEVAYSGMDISADWYGISYCVLCMFFPMVYVCELLSSFNFQAQANDKVQGLMMSTIFITQHCYIYVPDHF